MPIWLSLRSRWVSASHCSITLYTTPVLLQASLPLLIRSDRSGDRGEPTLGTSTPTKLSTPTDSILFLLRLRCTSSRYCPNTHQGGWSFVEFNRVASLVIVEAHDRVCAPVELGLCHESVDDHVSAKEWCLQLFVQYQCGDSSVPLSLSLQRSKVRTFSESVCRIIMHLEVDVTVRRKELLRNDLIPLLGRYVEWCDSSFAWRSMLQWAAMSCFVTTECPLQAATNSVVPCSSW